MRKVLITRAEEQAQEFSRVLKAKIDGVTDNDLLMEPILHIHKNMDVALPYLSNFSIIIVTSVHGCDLIPTRTEEFIPQFYCVGTATASALIAKGYQPGIVMQSAKDLVDTVSARHSGERERILYLKGRNVSVDIKTSLALVGHKVQECEVYRADLAEKFSVRFLLALKSKDIGAISFFSSRTANHFGEMIDDMGISGAMSGIKALCISDAVVGCLHPVFVGNSIVAPTPDLSGMVKAVEIYREQEVDK